MSELIVLSCLNVNFCMFLSFIRLPDTTLLPGWIIVLSVISTSVNNVVLESNGSLLSIEPLNKTLPCLIKSCLINSM